MTPRADFRDEQRYFLVAFDLVLSLSHINPQDEAGSDLREGLAGQGDEGCG